MKRDLNTKTLIVALLLSIVANNMVGQGRFGTIGQDIGGNDIESANNLDVALEKIAGQTLRLSLAPKDAGTSHETHPSFYDNGTDDTGVEGDYPDDDDDEFDNNNNDGD